MIEDFSAANLFFCMALVGTKEDRVEVDLASAVQPELGETDVKKVETLQAKRRVQAEFLTSIARNGLFYFEKLRQKQSRIRLGLKK